jgi:L-xylulokinase
VTEALLGIDLGQTRTKAVIVDPAGRQLGMASHLSDVTHQHARWAEGDLGRMWSAASSAIRAAVAAAGAGVDIVGVGVSGHSDGVYLVDAMGDPVRPAILAIDSRARRDAETLAYGPDGARLLEATGQLPMAASPGVVVRWLRDHEPGSLERASWILSSTDWLRLKLTGTVCTDPTMASAAFTSLDGPAWSPEVLRLYGVEELVSKLPPIVASDSVAGRVTSAAARLTGLREGTPVVAGAHDADSGAVGMGAVRAGSASLILGTYSINQVLLDVPRRHAHWQVRPFVTAGEWLHMSTSPAGAGCLDWVARRIGPRDGAGQPDSAAAVLEAESAAPSLDDPLFLPFVHGAPLGAPVGGSWLGLRSEHGRPQLLHAVMEGATFSHRTHMDALRTQLEVPAQVRVGGGGARSSTWTQLLADALDVSVEVTEFEEVSAAGAALLAGIGLGIFADLEQAVVSTVRVTRRQEPDPGRRAEVDQRYATFSEAVRLLTRLQPSHSG